MRVRPALDARLEGNDRVLVQVQDTRLFCEEENTFSDYRADNLDLHQGLVELTDDGIGVFNTLFAANHAFFGLYDLFLNIPAHTGGLGLKDAAAEFAFTLSPRTGLRTDLHNLQSGKEGDISTRSLANELDLTLSHQLSGALTVMSGYSYVQAKDGIKELERLSRNAHRLYLILNAGF
jgi:hypothetical protein